MQAGTRAVLKSLGCELSYGLIERTQECFASSVAPHNEAIRIIRDLAYGPDERHRLDVFHQEVGEQAPVLVYVHGGGFVIGDKRLSYPYYDNVGQWAAERGWIGVTINYRLAPDNMWPSGAEDLASLVMWLRDNIAGYGGDPKNIVLMGHAAGAAHVASYIALPRVQPAKGAGIRGAVLISGIYDPASTSPSPHPLAYFGADRSLYPEYSSVSGLVVTNVPLCFVVAEFDGIDYRNQTANMIGAYARARGDMPRVHWMAGHNHLSTVFAIGTPENTLGPLVEDFVDGLSRD